jgi:hypothetical protein
MTLIPTRPADGFGLIIAANCQHLMAEQVAA